MTETVSTPQPSPGFQPRTFRPHILKLLFPLLWAIIMLVPPLMISSTLNSMGLGEDPIIESASWLFGGLYLVFVISYFTMQVIFWYFDAWIITKNGLIDIQLVSLFNRRVAQLNWSQVQDVRVSIQGPLATLFYFGDIIVQTAGKEGVFELRAIPNARAVSDLIDELSQSAQSPAQGGIKFISPTQRLGEILIQQGNITESDLEQALQDQRISGRRLGQILVAQGRISREDLVKALSNQFHLPYIDLSRYDIDPNVVKLMPYATAVKYHAIPIHRSADDVLNIAVAEPEREKFTELMGQFDLPLTFLVADENYIQEAIAGYYSNQDHSITQPPITPPSLDEDTTATE
ncbi:MAG: PH domain-containing protein [Patescibacteria group bacterium]|jgi:membrane protein YdbS with pleckstrin-like domain